MSARFNTQLENIGKRPLQFISSLFFVLMISGVLAIIDFYMEIQLHMGNGRLLLLMYILTVFLTASIYAYVGGGIMGCLCICVAPLFFAGISFISVAPSVPTDHTPIWELPPGYSLTDLLQSAFVGALIWGVGIAILSFALGKFVDHQNQMTK